MMDLAGKTLGQYQIIEELGRGGMAIVYKAFQPSLNRYVAIKVLPQQYSFDQQFVERFVREARGAAALHHPNILTIHDVAEQSGTYFIVMEFLQGKTLDHLMEEGQAMPLPRAFHIIKQVADALDYAHSQGLIHRDIKPSNIMVDESRNDRVTLMDFGLARAIEGSGLTRTGVIVGTPEYMSPEQAQGDPVDHRTDIYSLGVVLYHMLTGHSPFARSTPHAALLAHLTHDPPSVSEINRALPRSVAMVVIKAMAKDQNSRYARASQMAQDLEIAISGKTPPGLTLPPRSEPKLQPATQVVGTMRPPVAAPGPKRNALPWVLGGAGALAVCAIAAVIVAVLVLRSQASPTPTAAVVVTATPGNAALANGPQLLMPEDATDFSGPDAKIMLEWSPLSLAAGEFYVVALECSGMDQPQITWVQYPDYQVPSSLYAKLEEPRRCQWHVTVMKQTGTDSSGARAGEARSQASDTRQFLWSAAGVVETETAQPTATSSQPTATLVSTSTSAPSPTPTFTPRPAATRTPAPTQPAATATPVVCQNGKVWDGSNCVCPPGTVWNDKAQWCGAGGGGGGGGGGDNTPAPP